MSRSGWSASPAASLVAQLRTVGRDLFLRGLVSSHSGNLSIRQGEAITITRHGSQLGHLGKNDLVAVNLDSESAPPGVAPSMELPRHRAIYRATGAGAIVHAHPPHAIALSLLETLIIPRDVKGAEGGHPDKSGPLQAIVPRDVEGAYLLREVPVIEPGDVAKEGLAEALASHPIAMLKGHGSFAVGASLEEALQWTTALEDSCLVLLWLRVTQGRK